MCCLAHFRGSRQPETSSLSALTEKASSSRLHDYFDPKISDEDMREKYPSVMAEIGGFDSVGTREKLRKRGMADSIIRYAYRPLDVRWLYWEPETKLVDRNRAEYRPHVRSGNLTLCTQQKPRREWEPPQVVQSMACLDLIDRGSSNFPLRLKEGPNLSKSVAAFLSERSLPIETALRHIVATLHAPTYRSENAGALRMNWPRVPLPGDANLLRASSALGATLATLLDPETPAPGVSTGTLRAGLKTLGLPTKRGGMGLDADDLNLTAGWGSVQTAGGGSRIVMPGRGLATERTALGLEGNVLGLSLDEVLALLGDKTFDIHLNGDAWWSNVPARVWDYTLGGYQVIKKWLSYREHDVLGRALKPDEAAYVSEMVRRIAAILLLGAALDKNYADSKAVAVEWKDGAPVV